MDDSIPELDYNDTNSTSEAESGDSWNVILISCYGTLFILGFANLVILYVIATTRALRTVSHIQIFNLCLSGFLYCGGLFFLLVTMYKGHWIFGAVLCKINFWIEATVKHASICFITLASFERYLAVCQLRFRTKYWTFRIALVAAICVWIVCILLVLPIFLFAESVPYDISNSTTIYVCRIYWPMDHNSTTMEESGLKRNFAVYIFVLLFAIPTLIIVACYFMVLSKLIQSSRRFMGRIEKHFIVATPSHSSGRPTSGPQTSPTSRTSRSRSSRRTKTTSCSNFRKSPTAAPTAMVPGRMRSRRKTYRKVTQMVLVIVGFYIACWSPYWTLNFLVAFVNLNQYAPLRIVFLLIHMLPYLNCALSPFLYGFLTDNFKSAIRDSP